jgi:hypothetical protein
MTTREASLLIGCSPRHARALASQGKLAAVRRDGGYDVSMEGVRNFLSMPQGRGWPRGKPRTGARV